MTIKFFPAEDTCTNMRCGAHGKCENMLGAGFECICDDGWSTIVKINLVITEDSAKIMSTDSAVIVLMAGRVKLAVGRSFALVCHNMLLLLVVFKQLWRRCLKVHLGTPNCVSLNHFIYIRFVHAIFRKKTL